MTKDAPVHVQLKLDKCLWCGKALPDGRYDRKTHNECRMKVHRWKRAPKKLQSDIYAMLAQIEQRLSHEWSFSEGVEALCAIEKRIREIYADNSIVRVK